MEFGNQQSTGLDLIRAWLANPRGPQIFRLFGYAGTGKTTIAREVQTMVRGRTIYGAYTGKAALVLRTKGCFPASTIHGLIYKADDSVAPPCPACKGLCENPVGVKCEICKGTGDGKHDGKPIFRLNPESPLRGAALMIVDECSMVGEDLGRDLCSFGVRILVLGDPAQLGPVVKDGTAAGGYFTNAEPDFMLTEIHRQALENPIIRMSMDVREGRGLKLGTYGESRVIMRKDIEPGEIMAADQVLCGLNNTRRGLNYRFREKLGYTEEHPQPGDRLVCLKNDRERQLYNGSLWETVESEMDRRFVKIKVSALDQGGTTSIVPVVVPIEFFLGTENNLDYRLKRSLDQFDFGYALTVHKSQGSQWPHVMLFDESYVFRDDAKRHLYTGLTRAADKVTIIV